MSIKKAENIKKVLSEAMSTNAKIKIGLHKKTNNRLLVTGV